MLSLFLKITRLSTSTKPILKEVFIKYTQNKVVQLSNNPIANETTFFD
jgi:hypothetical protein